jgi:hypothetical protein
MEHNNNYTSEEINSGNNSDNSTSSNENINRIRKAGRPAGSYRKSQEPKEKGKAGRPVGSFTKTRDEKLKTRREWMKEHYKTDTEAHERQKERMRNYYNKNRKIILEASKNNNIE